MAKQFFIADTHFGHKNILKFDSRPFNSIEEHDAELMRRWNSVVTNDDNIWILGDFCWKTREPVSLLENLNGRKHLVLGNHDHFLNGTTEKYFWSIQEMATVYEGGYQVFMSHYPIPWFPFHRREKGVHLYGHVHITPEEQFVEETIKRLQSDPLYGSKGLQINVGAMKPYMDYTPRTLKELIESRK